MGATLSFGFPGDRGLGDRLLAAVLRGEKTATSSLAVEYLPGEPLPRVGQRLTLVDHHGRIDGIVETTRVRIIPLDLVDDEVAQDEGEGFADAAAWRRGHAAFWAETADFVRADAGGPDWQLRVSEPVVVHWFGLVADTLTIRSRDGWRGGSGEEVEVPAPRFHGMDEEFIATVETKHYDLEQTACRVETKTQLTGWGVVVQTTDEHRMVCGVDGVARFNTVSAGGIMDLHPT